MNEQIKNLVKQAGLNIDGYGDPIWGCLDSADAKTQFLKPQYPALMWGKTLPNWTNDCSSKQRANC